MQAHQERVVVEKKELDEKILRLTEFVDGVTFSTLDEQERSRLRRQLGAMMIYSSILGERIVAFNNA